MGRQTQKMKNRIGLAPGSMVHIGNQKSQSTKISLINYQLSAVTETKCENITDIFASFQFENVSWINIDALHDLPLFTQLAEKLKLHPLLMEDILDTGQKPKLEIYEDHLLVIIKMITWNDEEKRIDFEQVSFVLGKNYLLSFQERQGDVFEHVRQRIRNPQSRIRKMKTDYLLYSLLDAIIDSYFLLLSTLGDQIEELEEELIKDPSDDILTTIHHLKHDVLFLRKSIWHLRTVISNLNREDFQYITPELHTYLRDLYDNTVQVMDTIETYREIISGMLDIYLSSLSNRMNQVMKVLTIFAAIFIPLTFVAGVYGMNFQYMPELGYKWAYPIWWVFVIIITVGMVIYFKKKKWM